MPTANDEDVFLAIPERAGMELVSVCQQPFNKCPEFKAQTHGSTCLHLIQGRDGSSPIEDSQTVVFHHH